jgi:hypothetical protein
MRSGESFLARASQRCAQVNCVWLGRVEDALRQIVPVLERVVIALGQIETVLPSRLASGESELRLPLR